MITLIEELKKDIIKSLPEIGEEIEPILEVNKQGFDSHFSSNIAMVLSKKLQKKPIEIAESIKIYLLETNKYESVEIQGPGFLNIKLKPLNIVKVIDNILHKGTQYGSQELKNTKINIEYVSANPTGNLHIGHARNAVIGNTLSRILKFSGYDVSTEYYVNDAGNQINVLALTVFINYLWIQGIEKELPEDCYKGEIYKDLAQDIFNEFGNKFNDTKIENNLISDILVLSIFKEKSINFFLTAIKEQLKNFGVEFDHFTSEADVYKNKEIDKLLDLYKEMNSTYEEDGAVWLKTTEFGDDKDRVLVKKDKNLTYIVPDIATHNLRIKRTKADILINVWGGDHHGYIPRIKAGLQLLGFKPDILEIEIVQMVRLIKDNQEFKMSKRKGTAVWLQDVLDIVGKDALRYMLASKSSDSHMDLDLDLLVQKNASNPVYYAQYVTARCYSILEKAKINNIDFSESDFSLLNNKKELDILIYLDNFYEVIKNSARKRASHILCDYIQNIAKNFHSYYSDNKIIDLENIELTKSRINFIKSILQVVENSFELLGIRSLEKM